MAGDYSWQDIRGGSSFRLPGPEHIGGWVGVALLFALLLHVALFLALGQIRVALGLAEPPTLETDWIHLEQVEVTPASYDEAPEPQVEDPPENANSLLEEIDILDHIPEDTELDIRPDISEPEIAMRLETPALEGELLGETLDPVVGPIVDAEIADFGRTEDFLEPAPGQVVVDPGEASADLLDPDEFTEQLIKKGAEGLSDRGVLEGFTSLDDMLNLPGNTLTNAKGMIGSDLLFEYNSTTLRQSAKVSLMKVALLLDRNPDMYCWIEGHTDLYGGDQFNVELSRKRAAAVREYLVETLRFDGDRIIVRGFGESRPLVEEGSVEEQALNRRVEIKMRNRPPENEPVLVRPERQPEVERTPSPRAETEVEPEPEVSSEPVLVRPKRALPVEEETPRAVPVVPRDPAPRALPVEEAAPRARPVEENEPIRALPVEEP